MPRRAALAACLLALCATPSAADAATLRGFALLHGGSVLLSDLFAGLQPGADRALGPAPQPGQRIVVEAPQLAAIARDYNVAWRPVTGAERSVLERAGAALPPEILAGALQDGLRAAGAPADAELTYPPLPPVMLPEGAAPSLTATGVSYDSAAQRFSLRLTVRAAGMAPLALRLAGTLAPMTDAIVLARHKRPGAALEPADLRLAHIKLAGLHGRTPLAAASLIGMALRHDMAEGAPLTDADVKRPVLVTRNEAVRMALEEDGISLQARGVALEDGGAGDQIRVQNPTSRAVLLAEVISPAAVRVVPGLAAASGAP